MVALDKIVGYLDRLLDIDAIDDHSWNGLQVEGKPDVKSVMFAVDAGIGTFRKAVGLGVDLVVVHHGLFWKSVNPSVRSSNLERLNILMENKISLYAAHLPLDRHDKIGNNAQLISMLGGKITDAFIGRPGSNIGWIGTLKPTPLDKIVKILESGLGTACTVLAFGKKKIETVAVCSGSPGHAGFQEASDKRVDLYLIGEQTDIYHSAKDASMNVIFAGHHASEILGVKALAEMVGKRFRIRSEFIDIPTGL